MTTRVEFIKTWKARTLVQLNKLAHQALSSQLTFDNYNIHRGRYKSLQDLLIAFDEEIKRINGGDDDDAVGEPDPSSDDADYEAPVTRRRQARQPRAWG